MTTNKNSLGLLERAPRMGARLSVRVDGCRLWVSTVLYARERFTRVEADECQPCFYPGEIDGLTAGRMYMDGV